MSHLPDTDSTTWNASFIDDIDHLPFRDTFKLTHFGRLPTELLPQVAECLEPYDLAQLARTCKDVRPVSEKVLYQTVRLETDISMYEDIWATQVFGIYENVTNFPKKLVRFHRTTLSRQWSESMPIKNLHALLTPYKAAIEIPIGHGLIRNPVPLTQTATVYVTESRLVGMILRNIPSLHSLFLNTNMAGMEYYTNIKVNELQALFGSQVQDQGFNLSDVPGLKDLKYLMVEGPKVQSQWLSLPKLRHIKLIRPTIMPYENFTEHSFLETLEFNCYSSILVPNSREYQNFGAFLKQCPKLSTIRLCMQPQEDSYGDIVESGNRGNFVALINQLKEAPSSLITLEIATPSESGCYYLRYASPALTFIDFLCLRSLSVPYEALAGSLFSADFLPSSLEQLEIRHPPLRVLTSIRSLARQITSKDTQWSYLRKLTILCSNCRGFSYDRFQVTEGLHQLVRELSAQGIYLHLAYEPDEYNPDWECLEYDVLAYDTLDHYMASYETWEGLEFKPFNGPLHLSLYDREPEGIHGDHSLRNSFEPLSKGKLLRLIFRGSTPSQGM
ncbi:hypothetical protein B0J11DRAFT_566353 [Dendryphion nanum]|uniref:F-box domain-containing protein n=1 Tax=Dendryphion nanum TaxID=256645 RepID=A0A9P9E1L9_9PLEO|nr:hypothetical protein B0J11DRAFT_566353 [Dendryphion nanum]